MIFPLLYNGPLLYFSLLLKSGNRKVFEQFDTYSKQTYRNRCTILGGNGPINLIVPIIKEHGIKTKMKDARIDYDTDWQRLHWNSIESAYASSPFFSYFSDLLLPYYREKTKYLVDLNLGLFTTTCEILGISIEFELSERFLPIEGQHDLRESIHPKKKADWQHHGMKSIPYYQVFEDRHGFQENLSILDLISNEGENAVNVLRQMQNQ